MAKFVIPYMEDLVYHIKRIKIIKRIQGEAFFFKITLEEMSYTFYNHLKKEDAMSTASYLDIRQLEDIEVLTTHGYFGSLKIDITEIIRQIPSFLINKVVAIEIVNYPRTSSDFLLNKEEYEAGYHVSTLRLYKKI